MFWAAFRFLAFRNKSLKPTRAQKLKTTFKRHAAVASAPNGSSASGAKRSELIGSTSCRRQPPDSRLTQIRSDKLNRRSSESPARLAARGSQGECLFEPKSPRSIHCAAQGEHVGVLHRTWLRKPSKDHRIRRTGAPSPTAPAPNPLGRFARRGAGGRPSPIGSKRPATSQRDRIEAQRPTAPHRAAPRPPRRARPARPDKRGRIPAPSLADSAQGAQRAPGAKAQNLGRTIKARGKAQAHARESVSYERACV